MATIEVVAFNQVNMIVSAVIKCCVSLHDYHDIITCFVNLAVKYTSLEVEVEFTKVPC